MSELTKQQRIIAYRIVEHTLNRSLLTSTFRHDGMSDHDWSGALQWAEHIMLNLREDAADLWNEA